MVDYGTDISTYPDGLDPTFTPISGARAVAEVIARRFETPRGMLVGDPDFGLDVRGLLNEAISTESLYLWRRQMVAEVEKDERILSADVALSFDQSRSLLLATVTCELSSGPFTLVLAISAVGVEILEAA